MLDVFLSRLKEADREKVVALKGPIMVLRESLTYLTKHNIVAKDFGPKLAIDKLVEKYELDKRR